MSGFVKVITSICVVVAIVSLCVIGFSKVRYNIMMDKCTASVEGTVIDFRKSSFDSYSVYKTYASYKTDEGVFTAVGESGYHSVGDKVTVKYDPEKPSRAYVGAPLSRSAFGFGCAGLICSVAGAFSINMKSKIRRPMF